MAGKSPEQLGLTPELIQLWAGGWTRDQRPPEAPSIQNLNMLPSDKTIIEVLAFIKTNYFAAIYYTPSEIVKGKSYALCRFNWRIKPDCTTCHIILQGLSRSNSTYRKTYYSKEEWIEIKKVLLQSAKIILNSNPNPQNLQHLWWHVLFHKRAGFPINQQWEQLDEDCMSSRSLSVTSQLQDPGKQQTPHGQQAALAAETVPSVLVQYMKAETEYNRLFDLMIFETGKTDLYYSSQGDGRLQFLL
ncbi:hypothetical protein BTVI_82605 [Pitangus sulphuratus]|nr:hypothetical protein BTVI_82605 [Pitangus sulphuratus]